MDKYKKSGFKSKQMGKKGQQNNNMGLKKLSRTVRKRLNKKARLQSLTNATSNFSTTPKVSSAVVSPNNTHPERIPKTKVVYINKNYGGNDPDSIGARFQRELIGLSQQSKNIKSASDLTESQAHVVKRQITRLQGADKVMRPKGFGMSIDSATNELKLILEQQKKGGAKLNDTESIE